MDKFRGHHSLILRRQIFAVIFLTLFSLLGGSAAKAGDNAISLKIAPLSFNLKINPGEEQTGRLYIENSSDSDLGVAAEFSDFFVDDAGNYIFSDDKEIQNENLKPYLMKNWFSLNEYNFTLNKGENKVVDYKISVPPDAILGGHYGVIFFRTDCSLSQDKNVVSTDKSSLCVSGRVGTIFLVRVGGEGIKKGILKKSDIPRISWQDKSNLKIEITNVGNTHFKPEGSIIAKNIWGQKVFEFDIKDKTILPTMSQSFSYELKRNDFFGFYSISGAIKDGDGNEMRLKKWIFLVPWKELLAILVLVAFWIWFLKKYRIKAKS